MSEFPINKKERKQLHDLINFIYNGDSLVTSDDERCPECGCLGFPIDIDFNMKCPFCKNIFQDKTFKMLKKVIKKYPIEDNLYEPTEKEMWKLIDLVDGID